MAAPLDALELGRWLTRIKDAEQAQATHHPAWKRALALYDMSYWRAKGYQADLSDQITPVNYTTTFISTLVAATFSRNPKIFVRARRERFVRFAETMELLQERDWDENDLKEVLIESLIDALLTNLGWVENGFQPPDAPFPTREEAPAEAPRSPGESGTVLESLSAGIRKVFGGGNGQASEKPPVAEGELDERKQRGSFYCLRRSPYDVLLPKGYHSFSALPYLIVRDRLPAEDFLRNPRWQHKDLAVFGTPTQAGGAGKLSKADFRFPRALNDAAISDRQLIELFTVWDRRDDRVFTLSRSSPEPHFGPVDWPYYSEGFPLIPLQFNKVPDTPEEANAYGFSDVEPIIPQVLEKSNIRTDMVDTRRRASIVVFVQKGSTTEEELNAQSRAVPMAIIPVTNLAAIKESQPIQIPPATLQTEQAINSDLERDSGLQLILADLGRTAGIERATVASIAQGNANLKTGYRVDRLEGFARRIAKFRAGLFWQYMEAEEVGEHLGLLPSEDQWPPLPQDPMLARARVRKELELRIEAGSTRPIQDDVLDREQYLRWLTIFQSTSPQLYKRVERQLQAEMAKKFRNPLIEALVLQATSEGESEVAMQENQLLMANVPQIVGDCEDHETHMKVHAQAAQQGEPTQALDQHLLAHHQKLQEVQGAVRGAGQGVRQSAAAPSGAETRRMGVPSVTGAMGQGMNLREGTGSEMRGM